MPTSFLPRLPLVEVMLFAKLTGKVITIVSGVHKILLIVVLMSAIHQHVLAKTRIGQQIQSLMLNHIAPSSNNSTSSKDLKDGILSNTGYISTRFMPICGFATL